MCWFIRVNVRNKTSSIYRINVILEIQISKGIIALITNRIYKVNGRQNKWRWCIDFTT